MRRLLLLLTAGCLSCVAAVASPAPRPVEAVPRLALEPDPHAQLRFSGLLGDRIRRNTREWLVPAPVSNPGMIEMFRVRDRLPKPQLVPWAGEFAGKHLLASVQALRLQDDPELRRTVAALVRDLLATQAEDGYLGPFPKAERLKGNWDLWGHYHCLLGLLLWHEQSGDAAALKGARRAADLICATYLDTGKRVFDAGSHEMNMAVLHGLARLYRLTGEPRYLKMAREIETDWERAGDYLRTGLAGEEFFQTPRPRWESLPDLQGLLELYQITGEPRYRRAFEHHWRSIIRWDRRNTGGFSSGEQATGDPYAPTAIETCCTVAWMALSIDMLRLTGDSRVADELELSTYNAALGAQHPSGRWWTYNTPMDGVREASAHTIVFQARAGTPELNCCSVNGPRSLGMLAEWAVMRDAAGLTVNAYAPGRFSGKLRGGQPVALRWETDYPRSGHVVLHVEAPSGTRFPLRLRIPGWSAHTVARVNEAPVKGAVAGRYLVLDRRWTPGDRVTLDFDMRLRAVAGDRDALGKVSLYRGPLLLAFDPRDNPMDGLQLPPVDLSRLAQVKNSPAVRDRWLLVDVPAQDGRTLKLCDFASAGATGTHYRSWLPAASPLPPPAVTRIPRDGAAIPSGKVLFRWTGPAAPNTLVSGYRLVIASDPELRQPVVQVAEHPANWIVLDEPLRALLPGKKYWWGVLTQNANGSTSPATLAAELTLDPKLPPLTEAQLRPPLSTGILVAASLGGKPLPAVGKLLAAGHRPATGPDGRPDTALQLNGTTGRITFAVPEFPEEEYTVALRVRIDALPDGRLGQLFSAWTAPSDDPLRLCIEGGKLYARIEAGSSGCSTEGFPIQAGRWYRLVAVKEGARLTLYVDGAVAGQAVAPYTVRSSSREVALGGNPRYPGNEFLAATFADFSLNAWAFSAEEARRASRPQ